MFKSSRVVIDDKAFVLSTKAHEIESTIEVEEIAANEGNEPNLAANQIIESAKVEANQILEEADREYEQKMTSAQNSSDAIVANAYDQAKGIMEQSKAEGYQDGYNRGVDDSQEIAKQIIDEAIAIKEEWLQMRQDLFRKTEPEMINIVVEALEKVLDYKVETDQTLIESLIRQGISRVTKSHLVSIRVSNEDYNQALSIKPMLLATSDKIEEIDIKRDPSLQNGSCIIDTESGSIDSSLSTQLEQIKKLFDDLLKGD
ncbi:FliH/SctL family protein [Fusibacter bizertensis]|uniref:FliH/SctL family protein n=1 Tax=Fusibacter bizertensis TaxID=1488331 RepID=A0ABT6N888_9FIRM|nr:FliH/SctL family protein [Fusibacter bizertensis]MDH8676633.1 FliH/SctL family protein [Fusibacter bizertensis]